MDENRKRADRQKHDGDRKLEMIHAENGRENNECVVETLHRFLPI